MEIKLNLIPPYKKEEIKKSYQLRRILRWEAELFLILVLFTATLVSMSYILKIDFSSASVASSLAAKDNAQYAAIEKFDNEIKDMNTLVADVSKVQSGQLYWSKFLAKLNGKIISGIEIDSLTTKDFAVSLSGKADTRDNLLAFKNNIATDDCFTAVDLPLSDLVLQQNINFQMDFQIKKECLN